MLRATMLVWNVQKRDAKKGAKRVNNVIFRDTFGGLTVIIHIYSETPTYSGIKPSNVSQTGKPVSSRVDIALGSTVGLQTS